MPTELTLSILDSKDQPKASVSQESIKTPEGVVAIPLPKEFSALAISGDANFFNTFMDIITPLDRNLTTFARLPGAFETVYSGKFTVGAVNKGLSEHQEAAISYYVLLAVHTLYCAYLSKEVQKKKDQEIQNIYKLFAQKIANESKVELPENMDPISDEAEHLRQDIVRDHLRYSYEMEVDLLNKYLRQVLQSDEKLKAKYDYIKICHEDNTLWLKRKAEEKKVELKKQADETWFQYQLRRLMTYLDETLGEIFVWKHIVKPVFDSGFLAAVAFWLIWISAVATTGIQLEGIAKVSAWIGLGIPAGLGFMNLASYYYKAWKHGGFDKAQQHAEAAEDFQAITKALLLREHERDLEYLSKREHELSGELTKRGIAFTASTPALKDYYQRLGIKVPDGTLDAPLAKGAITLVSNSAGYWSASQTLAWYGKVLIETAYFGLLAAPFIGTAIGGAMLGLACVAGIYNGVKRYREAKELNKELAAKAGKNPLTLDQVETLYKDRVAYLEKLKASMQAYKKQYGVIASPHSVVIPRIFDVAKNDAEHSAPQTRWGKIKAAVVDVSLKIRNHPLVDAWDLSLSGIVIGRFIFATAAIFLPFTPVLLTGPFGVAAILAVGLAYVGMKWYESYQKKKEERMKQLPGKLEELEKDIQKAELVTKDMEMSASLIRDEMVQTQAAVSRKAEVAGFTYNPAPMFRKLGVVLPKDSKPSDGLAQSREQDQSVLPSRFSEEQPKIDTSTAILKHELS